MDILFAFFREDISFFTNLTSYFFSPFSVSSGVVNFTGLGGQFRPDSLVTFVRILQLEKMKYIVAKTKSENKLFYCAIFLTLF